MTNLGNSIKKMKSKITKKQLYIIIGIVVFCVLTILGIILYNYTTPNIKQVNFFKDIYSTDKDFTISKNKLYKKKIGSEYSFSLWLRINNWYKNDNNEKNIFSYGNKDTSYKHENAVPSVWLDSEKNDLNIYVQTKNGGTPTPVKVKNVPLQKWFKLTVVIKMNSIQVFINSKLDVFTFLKDTIIIPNGDLYLFTGEHKVDGEFANVVFYKQALLTSEVAKLYAVGDRPTKKSLLYMFVNFFTSIGKYGNDKTVAKDFTNC